MSPELTGVIGLIILLVLLFLGVYIGVSMAVIGFLGTVLIAGSAPALSNMFLVPFSVLNDFNFAVIPLFIVMSEFISQGGIGSEAFNAASAWFGNFKGGLAIAAEGACCLFAATSGSSMACAIVMGKVAYPEMIRFNYSRELAAGCIAAGGSIGSMIPPSIPFVVIGILTDVSIGKLFIAGIIPGITQAIFYVIAIMIMVKINPALAPSSPSVSLKEKVNSLRLTWPIIFLFILVMGSIYMGVFTAAEAAGIGAFGALVIGLARRKLGRKGIWESLTSSFKSTGMMLFLLTSALILNQFMAISRLPFVASDAIIALGLNRYIILAIVLFVYIIMGCFFDIMALLILSLPILFPLMMKLGFDPIWYGVMMCRMAEIGFITPPFGINLFALSGVVGIPTKDMYRGVIPFVVADCFHVVFLVAVPAVATFLPNVMR